MHACLLSMNCKPRPLISLWGGRDGPWLRQSAKEVNHRHNHLAKIPSLEAWGALELRELGSNSASGTY